MILKNIEEQICHFYGVRMASVADYATNITLLKELILNKPL